MRILSVPCGPRATISSLVWSPSPRARRAKRGSTSWVSAAIGNRPLTVTGRPDLNLALTKLHLFRLGSVFSTIIYLDADTLPLRPIDPLFELTEGHHFSACPDIGWPDCFNSGVMVVRPQASDFDELHDRITASADNNGSFDGADQGLLNQYFSEDGGGGQWNRLPFT